jgi:hypothetical protein
VTREILPAGRFSSLQFFWGDKGLEFWLETIDDRGDGLFVLNFHENHDSLNTISDIH